VKKSVFFGGLFFRPDFLILGMAVVFGLLLVGGLTPFDFKNTPPSEGEFEAIPVVPAKGDKSLQLKPITFKQCGSTTAVDLVLDRSGSIGSKQDGGTKIKIEYLKDATKEFVNLMSGESLIGMQSFATTASIDFKIDKLNTRKDLINSKISSLSPSGSTNMAAALTYARDELKVAIPKFTEYKFSLILLSDGGWNVGGDPTNVINEIKGLGVTIFTVAFGDKTIVNFMKKSATAPSDSFYSPGNDELKAILKQIAQKICKE